MTNFGDQLVQFTVKFSQNLFNGQAEGFHNLLGLLLDLWVALALQDVHVLS
jgi:hypothetical protein